MYPHNIHINIYVCIKTLENQSSPTESAIPGKKKKIHRRETYLADRTCYSGKQGRVDAHGGGPEGLDWICAAVHAGGMCVCVCM